MQLMAMRVVMLGLIAERNRLGGEERLLDVNERLKLDTRAAKYFTASEVNGQMVGPSALAGRLLFYVILLFGIPPFLQALGQQAARLSWRPVRASARSLPARYLPQQSCRRQPRCTSAPGGET